MISFGKLVQWKPLVARREWCIILSFLEQYQISKPYLNTKYHFTLINQVSLCGRTTNSEISPRKYDTLSWTYLILMLWFLDKAVEGSFLRRKISFWNSDTWFFYPFLKLYAKIVPLFCLAALWYFDSPSLLKNENDDYIPIFNKVFIRID